MFIVDLFNTVIVEPIFNFLLFVYAILPGHDFGIAIIILTVLIRLLMWPLVKKQLHQTKVMRSLQPELKKIKAKSGGDKQQEGRLMMELYREKGVSPFGMIGLLLLQLPIFLALFQVLRILTDLHEQIPDFTYVITTNLPAVSAIISDPTHDFNESLLGVVDLTKSAIGDGNLYLPVLLLALLAAIFQYIQSKQLSPSSSDSRRLRDIFRDQAAGKEVDQMEVSAAMTSKMTIFFPFITFFVAINFPGGLVLYFATQAGVAVLQQRKILNEDSEELEEIADAPTKSKPQAKSAAPVATKKPAPTKRKTVRERITDKALSKQAKLSGETTVRTFTVGDDKPKKPTPRPSTKKKKSSKSKKKRR